MGTQSSQRMDNRTVEILRTCKTGGGMRVIRQVNTNGEMVLEGSGRRQTAGRAGAGLYGNPVLATHGQPDRGDPANMQNRRVDASYPASEYERRNGPGGEWATANRGQSRSWTVWEPSPRNAWTTGPWRSCEHAKPAGGCELSGK